MTSLAHKRKAERKNAGYRSPPPARAAQTRPCICCTQPFKSSGPGNRMCDQCRRERSSEWPIL